MHRTRWETCLDCKQRKQEEVEAICDLVFAAQHLDDYLAPLCYPTYLDTKHAQGWENAVREMRSALERLGCG